MKETVRVGLLNISDNPEKTRENFVKLYDSIEGVETEMYSVRELDFPEEDEVDCVVITGSADSVYDDEEHINALRDWIAGNASEVPSFGVCYGHQAISDALGGEVEAMDEMELGYREVEHEDDEVFEGIPAIFTVFESHGDEVVEPPEGAEVLARNETGIQALKIDQHYSVQFHPEVDMSYAEELARDKDVSEEKRQDALESITEENYEKALVARRVFENFFEMVREDKRAKEEMN